MIGKIILWIFLGLLALILFVPIGADINYVGGELTVSAKVAGLLIKLLPKDPPDPNAPPKEKKPPKPKKPKRIKKRKKPKEEAENSGEQKSAPKQKKKFKLNFTAEEILSLVKKVLKGVGRILKLHVDRFMLHLTVAGDDPYTTARTFGYVNAALSALAPITRKKYKNTETDVRTEIDFTQSSMQVDFGICLTYRVCHLFGGIFIILFGALGILIKNKLRRFLEKRRAKKNGEAPQEAAAETKETLPAGENDQ